MKLLVVLEASADVRIPPQLDPRSGRVRADWLVRELEPASAGALDLALQVKGAQFDVEITLLHLGPEDNERWLLCGLARGCDHAVRVWDREAAQAGIGGKAVILAAAARVIGYDLVLSGTGGLLDPFGQLGALLAQCLGVHCVTQVTEVAAPTGTAEAVDRTGSIRLEFVRALERGLHERVEACLPLVAGVSASASMDDAEHAGEAGGSLLPPSVAATALLVAQEQDIPVWGLADLGVPFDRVRQADEPLLVGAPRSVRPRLRPVKAPDSALPAFERIRELVEGALERRAGRVVSKPAEEIAEDIFRTLRDEGWLDHLRPGTGP